MDARLPLWVRKDYVLRGRCRERAPAIPFSMQHDQFFVAYDFGRKVFCGRGTVLVIAYY
jgi:hypothetical protein